VLAVTGTHNMLPARSTCKRGGFTGALSGLSILNARQPR